MIGGQPDPDAAAEAVAHHRSALNAKRVKEAGKLTDPAGHVRHPAGLVAESEPRHVGGQNAEMGSEVRNGEPPVGVRRNTWSRAVHEHDRWPRARLQVVRLDAARVNV